MNPKIVCYCLLIGLSVFSGAFGNLSLMVALLAIAVGFFFALESFTKRHNYSVRIIAAGFLLAILISLAYFSLGHLLLLAFGITGFFLATN